MNINKSILLSKTFWVQVVTVLTALIPAVQGWLVSNPVEFLSALAAVNVLVRFVTSGRVTIFSSEDDGGKPPGGAGSVNLLLCLATAAVLMGALPSCTAVQSGEYPLTATISFRDPETGAKAGLSYKPRFRQPVVTPCK